jgi:hypothetical protein
MTKKVKIIIALILGVGVLGAGGYFGYKYLYKTPKKVVAAMQEKISSEKVKTCHYEMDFTLSGESENQPVTVNLDLEGDIDISDIENPKTKSDISGSVEYGGITFSSQSELVTLKEDLYFKFVKISPIPLGEFPIDLSTLKNQWIKISSSDLSGLYGIDTEKAELTPAQEEEIRKLIEETEFFSEIKALKPETIAKVKCYHYQVTVDKNALLEFMEKYAEIVGEKMTSSDKKALKELLDNIDKLSAELWIGKKDKFLYKAKSKFNFKIPEEGDKIGLGFTVTLSKYNEKVEIEEPKGAKSLEDIMSEYYKSLYGGEGEFLPEMPEIEEGY